METDNMDNELLEPPNNFRQIEVCCSNCKHLNCYLYHPGATKHHAVRCARPHGPTFNYNDLWGADTHVCDGFERKY